MKFEEINCHSLERELEKYGLPAYMASALDRYLCHGIKPNRFLTAILKNDLISAATQAGIQNEKLLYKWARFVSERMPLPTYGDNETVEKWIQNHD